jgi:hypothetical protein
MVSGGLASKPAITVFSGLVSKPVAMVFSNLASKLVATVSPGLASESAVSFLVEPQDIGPSARTFCSRSPAPNSKFPLGAAGLVFLALDFSHRFLQGDLGLHA